MNGLVTWARERAAAFLEVPFPRRWARSGVADRAKQAASMSPDAENELLTATAVLHDVGYSPEIAKSGFRPFDGARALSAATSTLGWWLSLLTTPVRIEVVEPAHVATFGRQVHSKAFSAGRRRPGGTSGA